MKPVIATLSLCVLAFLSDPLAANDPAKPKLDRFGDPIPAGADICLGTTRFRHGGSGLQVEFTADGDTLVTANIPNYGHTVSFCDVHTGKLLAELSTGDETIKAFAVSANRKTAAVMTTWYEGKKTFLALRLVDLVQREWISRTSWEPPRNQAYANWGIVFTPDSRTILTAERGGQVLVWDADSLEKILDYKMSLPEKTYLEESITISADGETLISFCWGAGIALWNWTAGRQPEIIPTDQKNIACVAASPEGNTIAYGTYDNDGTDDGPDVFLWDIATKRVVKSFRFLRDEASVEQLDFSPDGKLLAAADRSSQLVRVWDTGTGELVQSFDAVPDRTYSLAFSPDGRLLAAAGSDGGCIRIWDVKTGERLAPTGEGHDLYVLQVAFPAKSTGRLVTASDDGAVFHWNLENSQAKHSMRHRDSVRGVAVSPDGRLIASSGLSDDNTVRLWDADSGKELFHFPGHGRSGGHRPVTFLKDGKQIASFGEDMNLRLWDTASGEKIAEYALRPTGIDFSKYRADRQRNGLAELLSSSSKKTEDKTETAPNKYEGDVYVSCHGTVFSPDGSQLVIPFGLTLYVFETATGKQLRKLENPLIGDHRAVSPDNRWLVTCGPEYGGKEVKRAVILSDLISGQQIWHYELPGPYVNRTGPGPVAFSPDGRLLAFGVREKDSTDRIEVWNAQTQQHLLTIDQIPDMARRQSLSISADNRYIANGQTNSTILVWDLLEEGLPESMIAKPVRENDPKSKPK